MLWRHLLGYLPVNIAQAVAGFGGIFLLTRLLSPQEYGLYGLAFAVMVFFHTILFSWMEAAMARFYAKAEAGNTLNTQLKSAYLGLALLAALGAVIGGLAISFLPIATTFKSAIGFALAAALLRAGLNLTLQARRAAREVSRYSLIEFFHISLGFSLGMLLVVVTDLGAAGPFAGMAVAAGIALVFDLPQMLKRAKGGQFSIAELKVFALYGMPISISLVLEYALSSADRFLIAGYLGTASVGVYTAGYGLANRTLDIIFVWAGMAAAPLTIAALEHGSLENARTMARKAFGFMALLTFPAATGLALVAAPLAAVMTGPAFRDQAASIIPWIALAGLMNGVMTYYLHEAFTLSKRTGMMAAVMAFPAVLNILLNMALLPRLGLQGAVIATVIAYFAGMVLSAIIGLRYFPLPLPWSAAAKTLGACAVMAAGVMVVPWPQSWPALALLGAQAALGFILYGLAALFFNLANCREFLTKALARFTPPKEAPVQ
jgi:O-antigen/teichoic acid export membrane protein